jgi:hypothetical protein
MNTLLVSNSVGGMLKSHIDYPIINVQWVRMDNIVLWDYLTTLHLIDSSNSLVMFQGTLDVFYLRHRHNNDSVTKVDYNSDPWGRKFVMYPPMLQYYNNDTLYEYYTYFSYKMKYEVNIIVTTVSRSKVYCVDLIKETV